MDVRMNNKIIRSHILPIRKLLDLFASKAEYLVDIFEAVGVTADGKVHQGNQKRGDVLNREVRSRLKM